jgi:hypothetical protein
VALIEIMKKMKNFYRELLPLLTHPILIFLIAFLLYALTARYLIGPDITTCSDGWRSSSIGTRGACSHHGGVQGLTLRRFLQLVFSGGAAYWAFYLRSNAGRAKSNINSNPLPKKKKVLPVPRVNIIHKGCPVLGPRCDGCQSVTEMIAIRQLDDSTICFWVCPSSHTCGKSIPIDTKFAKELLNRLAREYSFTNSK